MKIQKAINNNFLVLIIAASFSVTNSSLVLSQSTEINEGLEPTSEQDSGLDPKDINLDNNTKDTTENTDVNNESTDDTIEADSETRTNYRTAKYRCFYPNYIELRPNNRKNNNFSASSNQPRYFTSSLYGDELKIAVRDYEKLSEQDKEKQKEKLVNSRDVQSLASKIHETLSEATSNLTSVSIPDVSRIARAIVSGIVGNGAAAFDLASAQLDFVSSEMAGTLTNKDKDAFDYRHTQLINLLSEEGFFKAIIDSILNEYLPEDKAELVKQLMEGGLVGGLEKVTQEQLRTALEEFLKETDQEVIEKARQTLIEKLPDQAQDFIKVVDEIRSLDVGEIIDQIDSNQSGNSLLQIPLRYFVEPEQITIPVYCSKPSAAQLIFLPTACRLNIIDYKDNLAKLVDEEWRSPRPPHKGIWTAKLIYDLQNNGSVTDIIITKSSGYAPIDRSAVSRVNELQLRGYFPSLPRCFEGDLLRVDHKFIVIYR